jgi:hypothetical protein
MGKASIIKGLHTAIKELLDDSVDLKEEVVEVMLDQWFFDILDKNSPKDFSWWELFEEWCQSEEPSKMKSALWFEARLLEIMMAALQMLAKNSKVAGGVQQLVKCFQEFHRGKPRPPWYHGFIQAMQHTFWEQLPVICVVGGHSSGDMFGIGASALLKDNLHVVVYQYDKDGQDHAGTMVEFFAALLTEKRVKHAKLEKKVSNPSRKHELISKAMVASIAELMAETQTFCWIAPYNMGTYFLMNRFPLGGETARARIREGFQVDYKEINPKIAEFVTQKTLPLDALCNRRILVLWSRFSGKKGYYHAEHDSSFHGIAQLVWLATELGYYVIIAGDKPVVHTKVEEPGRRAGRYDEICLAVAAHYGQPRCFNMTEFWTELEWKNLKASRITQFHVYEHLHRHCDVRHLGMRSGNMEALALLGYFVRYMEEVGSWGGPRMEAWHGKGIGYERILLKQPPTRLGKYLQQDRIDRTVADPWIPEYVHERNRSVPGTGSKYEPTVDKLFAPKLEKFKTIRRHAPDPNSLLTHGFNETTVDLIRVAQNVEFLRKAFQEYRELDVKGEKPEQIRELSSGFGAEDLRTIVRELLILENPRALKCRELFPEEPREGGTETTEELSKEFAKQKAIWRKMSELLSGVLSH